MCSEFFYPYNTNSIFLAKGYKSAGAKSYGDVAFYPTCRIWPTVSEEKFSSELRRLAPEGFDDIVLLAPVPKLIEAAVPFAAEDAVLNAFAGLSRGTMVTFDLRRFARREGLRAIGSSGSRVDDMAVMMEKTEGGEMDTDRSVAAISGIYGVWKGLKAVIENPRGISRTTAASPRLNNGTALSLSCNQATTTTSPSAVMKETRSLESDVWSRSWTARATCPTSKAKT